ncbi:MAG: radical SAM protein [Kyrpidia sp.]|nr:radical SAM protein [Kyrpidia sp.]
MARRTYERITTKRTMNRVQTPCMPFSWSINPYRGCAHGCSFCYARTTHAYLGMQADDTFQNHIFVKENAAEALESQLARAFRRGGQEALEKWGLVAVGTATDPYQPIEARMKLTRECLKVLAKYRIPLTITTRSPLILRDMDVLSEANVRGIHISVNTLDSVLWRRMEPESPSPRKRLEAVQTLVERGLNAGIFLAPILPGLTDGDGAVRAVLEAARGHHTRFAVASMLRLAPDVKEWYMRTLRTYYPELVPLYERLYRRTNPPAVYAEEVLVRVRRWMRRLGIPFYRESADADSVPEPRPVGGEMTRAVGNAEKAGNGSNVEPGTQAVQLSMPL